MNIYFPHPILGLERAHANEGHWHLNIISLNYRRTVFIFICFSKKHVDWPEHNGWRERKPELSKTSISDSINLFKQQKTFCVSKCPHFPGDSGMQTFSLILFTESHHSCHSLMLMTRSIWFSLSPQIGWDYKESVIRWAYSNDNFPVNKITLQSRMSWHMEDFMNESMLILLELLAPVCVSKFTKIKPKFKPQNFSE